MIIWVLDCATITCTKIRLSDERAKEMEEVFDDCVEEFLYMHEKELGINMNYCSWMVTCEDNYKEMNF